ncbi:hypothetical protein D7030_02455 [Flavobacteriaceae bacterium AU392]|nr:hypothetical protein D1817_08930 [Flavobacteriaceae bacterium]RKM85555.1 hypothetical protein D7030_02455 [Flavobacteriaceae bacterium AU392]
MTNSSNKPAIWFWVVAVISLIWNAMGVFQYLIFTYKTESYQAAYTAEELEIMNNLPSWYIAVFAIAVFAGVLGSLFLLLRKNVAKTMLLISAIAVVIQMGYLLLVIKIGEPIMPIVVVVFSIFLVWFSRMASNKDLIS